MSCHLVSAAGGPARSACTRISLRRLLGLSSPVHHTCALSHYTAALQHSGGMLCIMVMHIMNAVVTGLLQRAAASLNPLLMEGLCCGLCLVKLAVVESPPYMFTHETTTVVDNMNADIHMQRLRTAWRHMYSMALISLAVMCQPG